MVNKTSRKVSGRRGQGQLALLLEDAPPSARRVPSRQSPKKNAKPAAVKPTKKSSKKSSKKTAKKTATKTATKTVIPKAGPAPAAASRRRKERKHETAVSLAAQQREISVSEFFTKNRHLLGFDNPAKALLTTIKEAVDNALDACEEAGILPELHIKIRQLAETRFRVSVQDNGPGIVREQIPKVFGKLLYGSKFHRLRQSRGQQGIGISAAGMYGQLTTGKGVRIISRTGPKCPAHEFLVQVDTRKNQPKVLRDEEVEWDSPQGTLVEIELEGTYRKGRRSVDDYLQQTAMANPHATIRYTPPSGTKHDYERQTDELPPEAKEIKPHPHGIELGMLMHMLHETQARNLRGALTADFSRVSPKVADEILAKAHLAANARPKRIASNEAEKLYKAIQAVRILNPPTSCVVPIGEETLTRGLKAQFAADFYAATTRPPAVYRGNPFVIEAGLAYGGALAGDELADLYRFANRVPLLYQQGACAMTKSTLATAWRNYTLQQSRGALPVGPLVILVHIASVWVPFTSESKEAIAPYPEIVKEIRLALQECGRKLGTFLRRRRRVADEEKKRSYIDQFIPHIGESLQSILALSDAQKDRTVKNLQEVLEKSRKL